METFQAVFENGALRPLQPVDLHEHEVVSVAVMRVQTNVPTSLSGEEQQGLRQRGALLCFIAKMEAMTDERGADGYSNRDHDRLIYGS
jgi:predicted DNA-binding antitoxin AbrB/MazE fold protein